MFPCKTRTFLQQFFYSYKQFFIIQGVSNHSYKVFFSKLVRKKSNIGTSANFTIHSLLFTNVGLNKRVLIWLIICFI